MKQNIPCGLCNKERMIDTAKWSVARYLKRSPNCRKCATKQPALIAKISKGWLTSERLFGNKLREGISPWNKGVKGYMGANSGSFTSARVSGAANHNWKGGITPENQKIRHSKEYMDWRTAVFQRDDYTCQECGSRGYKLNADHIKPFAYFPELRLAIDNGRTLCKPCHRKTPTYSLGARKIYGTKKA